ncbi:WYL domain-containing protein [Halobacteriovorax sp. RZ-1]|uniref:helix-turn-helix transcriptional regulator n=1 Tax=unclassified Halobacteriovorax TaxID=2639665 RepID=UPI0037188F4B
MKLAEKKSHIFNYLLRNSSNPPSVTEIHDYLSSKCEISRKQVSRYLEEFLDDPEMNMEITGKSPKRYKLLSNSNFRHDIKLSNENIETILLGLSMLESYGPIPLEQNVEDARRVLLSAVKNSNYNLEKFNSSFLFPYSNSGKAKLRDKTSLFKILEAIRTECVFKANYKKLNGEKGSRLITPLFFYLSGAIPFIYGFDMEIRDYRNFKIARFNDIELLKSSPVFKPIAKDLKRLRKEIEHSIGGYTSKIEDFVTYEIHGNNEFKEHCQEVKIHPSEFIEESPKGAILKISVPDSSIFDELFQKGKKGVTKVLKY